MLNVSNVKSGKNIKLPLSATWRHVGGVEGEQFSLSTPTNRWNFLHRQIYPSRK